MFISQSVVQSDVSECHVRQSEMSDLRTVDRQMRTLYFHPVVSAIFFFPRLISAAGDCMSAILPHMALVRIQDTGLKRAARGSLEIQDAKKSPKIAIWAPSHNFVGYIFAAKARINYRKNAC